MSKALENAPNFPLVEKNVDLSKYNTLGISAIADTFIEIKSASELEELFRNDFFSKNQPFYLGGGSNILLKGDLAQPVLKISIPGIEVVKEEKSEVFVQIGAGVIWHEVVVWCVQHNLGGIENLALIPGTTGAAPIQNIGAYGVEFDQVLEKLTAFDVEEGVLKTFKPQECDFAYRNSIFKNEYRGKMIITDVTLRLKNNSHQINIDYYALSDYMEMNSIKNPGISDVFDAVVAIRTSKLPDPSLLGNAGSFFKNPIVEESVHNKLQKNYPAIPSYVMDNNEFKIPAGWLIEQAGWKGKRIGNVGTYKNQALVIVNFGGATGEEIYQHAKNIQKSVREKFGIDLKPEVNIVGSHI